MTDRPKYRKGQRVHIEWPGGEALDAYVTSGGMSVNLPWGGYLHLNSLAMKDATVRVLSDPEPTGLGAVVEAASRAYRRHQQTSSSGLTPRMIQLWRRSSGGSGYRHNWAELIDPVVLSEGWTP